MDCAELLQQMIRIPSFAGEEREIASFLGDKLRDICDRIWVDELNNVVGIIEGQGDGPTIMLNGHIDHAFVGDMEEPFSGKLMDGKLWGRKGPVIYGRGACDNKGAVAAMVSAAAEISKRRNFKGRVIIAAVALEETGDGTGIKKVLNDLQEKPDIVLSGEATDLDICLGHRGKVEFLLETIGLSAHVSNPGNGINAIFLMNDFINAWKQVKLPSHEILGQCTSAISNIRCTPGKYGITPDHCFLTFDRRYLYGENPQCVQDEVQSFLNGLSIKNPNFKFKLQVLQTMPPFLTPKENPFVHPLLQAVRTHSREPSLRSWLFGTDGAYIVNEYGIPTVGFGPGSEQFAHTPADHVPVDHLQVSTKVYRDFVVNSGN